MGIAMGKLKRLGSTLLYVILICTSIANAMEGRGGWGMASPKASTKSTPQAKSKVSTLNRGWGAPGAQTKNIRQTIQTIGTIDRPASVSNCSCVTNDLCLPQDTANQGEGVINPRHACAPGYICCIHP